MSRLAKAAWFLVNTRSDKSTPPAEFVANSVCGSLLLRRSRLTPLQALPPHQAAALLEFEVIAGLGGSVSNPRPGPQAASVIRVRDRGGVGVRIPRPRPTAPVHSFRPRPSGTPFGRTSVAISLKRGVPCFVFFPGRSSDSCFAQGKIELGNPRRSPRRQSLGQGCRPPRSFFGGAVILPIQYLMPLRETHRAGVPEALQKAGVGDRVWGRGRDGVQRQ